jgi:hypothetical protein
MFVLMFVFQAVASANGIKNTEDAYDLTEDSSIDDKITVHLNDTGQVITKAFYGSQLDSGSPVPLQSLLDELQLGMLRIGGNEYDVFNWKTKKTIASNGEIRTINGFEDLANSLKQYKIDGIFQVNLTGFEPQASVTGNSNKRTFTPQSAYEMVKYLNGNLHLNISNFCLGNEFSIWHETHSQVWPTKDGISADEFIDRYIDYVVAIKRAQKEISGNPDDIKIWGPEISTSWLDWNTGNFSQDCDWSNIPGQVVCSYGKGKFDHFIPYFLNRLKIAENDKIINPSGFKLLDYLTIHYYPNFRTKISDPHSVITNETGRQLVAEILEATRVLNDTTYINNIDISSFRKIGPNIIGRTNDWIKKNYPGAKLAINEFAVDSDYRSNSYHPIIRQLYMADSLGILANENVAFVNQFILSSDKATDVPWSMIANGNERQNLFYMYKMYTNYFKGTVLKVDDSFGDVVNAYATSEGDLVKLVIVNKDPMARKVKIYLEDGSSKKIATYSIPGWSTSVMVIDKTQAIPSRKYGVYQYGAIEMGIPLDLSYTKKTK